MTALSCSVASGLDEPLAGTATEVQRWLCIEQPSAWGRDVLGDAVLGDELTKQLARRAKQAGARVQLIRRPGRASFGMTRTVFVSDRAGCRRFEVAALDELLELDFEGGTPVEHPVVLVCAHGKRDQCCARLGRPIAAELAQHFPDVWESSHTGGHRFAPALIVLPTGYTYGRLGISDSIEVVAAAGRGQVALRGLRGRASTSPIEQVAEVAVRREFGSTAADVVVEGTTVRLPDGSVWSVDVIEHKLPPRPKSCGEEPKSVKTLIATGIRPLLPANRGSAGTAGAMRGLSTSV